MDGHRCLLKGGYKCRISECGWLVSSHEKCKVSKVNILCNIYLESAEKGQVEENAILTDGTVV